jgi:tetratricopeptide (TPR) repeat protein
MTATIKIYFTYASGRFVRSRLAQARAARWKLVILALLFATAIPARSQVRVWEGVLELPVYEEGAPDSNVAFDQFATDRFNYPYTLRTEITEHPRVHSLRAIYLENEYLKCSVLPDIGGHVYTCLDKISGQPMFYANPSIKKARIGYRGAWAAFGVEFNFPVSHNWMSMSPVDFAYATNGDGSASVTVGNIDRVYGMEWSVELILRPGSTVLEQRARLSNRSDVRQRFYWWSNAGVRIWDDSRIEYPMRYTAAHGFAEVARWPVNLQGKDLSIIKNQTDGPVSVFVHGSREDFMGIWHPHTNAGTAHYARYDELPAKKIWSWGVDADGLDWRKALSDDDSAYAEVQGGLFRDQETYAFLEPRQHIDFSEYWMPVRGTGGISRANLAGVVHLERKDESLVVSLNVNREMAGATVRVMDGSAALVNEKVDLVPEKTWTNVVRVPDRGRKCTFELSERDGRVLLRQTEGEYDWAAESEIKLGPQKNKVFPAETERTEDDWVQAGATQELNGEKLVAAETYQKALRKYPDSFALSKAYGRVLISLKRFDEAAPQLAAAHARNTTDGEISYYQGLAEEAGGSERAALNAYEAALRSPEHRGSAALRLAELKAGEGKLVEARGYMAESLQSNPEDLRALEEQVAIADAMGRPEKAARDAKELLRRFPLSAFLREEAGEPDLAHLGADPYRVLNVAAEYARLGMYRRAVQVLSRDYPEVPADQREPGFGLPQKNPLIVYSRGYCREKLGESGSKDYMEAAHLSTLYVFPSTTEEKKALEAALRSNARDASAHSLLGTWYFARAMTTEALREWQAAREVSSNIPALDASFGLALLHEKRDFAGALDAFKQGIKNDPENVVNYSGGLAALTLLGEPASARVKMLERYPDLNKMPTPLIYELALNRTEAGDYDGAIAVFHDRFFGREEGGTNVRQVWIEVKLQQASGLAKNGQCKEAVATTNGLGEPVQGLAFTRDGMDSLLNLTRTNYLLGEVYAVCGQKEKAEAKFRLAAGASGISDLVWARAAAKNLDGYDAAAWVDRLNNAISHADANEQDGGGTSSWSMYTAGILRITAGDKERGQRDLREVFLLPDTRMAWHLSRAALDGGKR